MKKAAEHRCRVLDARLAQESQTTLHLKAVGAVFILLLFDSLSGPWLSVSSFYLIPVGALAWYGKGAGCYLLAAFSSVASQSINLPKVDPEYVFWYALWNDLIAFCHLFALAYLIQKLRGLLNRERGLSRLDPLTSLPNRRALLERLEAELGRAQRCSEPLAVGYLDLDRFKEVNDRFGHSEGDRLLKAVSRSIRTALRRSDTVARIGGDEFVFVAGNCTLEQASVVGEKVLQAVARAALEGDWDIGASVGVLVLDRVGPETRAKEVLSQADNLMYQVKRAGRNGLTLASAESAKALY